jgi:hypothetical protein
VIRVILALACAALASTQALGAACEVFEHRNFAGASLAIEGSQSLPRLGTLNDRVSSIKVAPQCLLVAYADEDYRGLATTFSQGEHASLPDGWDDEISSLRCNCR